MWVKSMKGKHKLKAKNRKRIVKHKRKAVKKSTTTEAPFETPYMKLYGSSMGWA